MPGCLPHLIHTAGKAIVGKRAERVQGRVPPNFSSHEAAACPVVPACPRRSHFWEEETALHLVQFLDALCSEGKSLVLFFFGF